MPLKCQVGIDAKLKPRTRPIKGAKGFLRHWEGESECEQYCEPSHNDEGPVKHGFPEYAEMCGAIVSINGDLWRRGE